MTEYITNIPVEKLRPFPNHPFQVRDDDSMRETVESIKTYGVLQPAIVRPAKDGDYEILSGHRRKRACELAGRKTIPAIVREFCSWWTRTSNERTSYRVNVPQRTR